MRALSNGNGTKIQAFMQPKLETKWKSLFVQLQVYMYTYQTLQNDFMQEKMTKF